MNESCGAPYDAAMWAGKASEPAPSAVAFTPRPAAHLDRERARAHNAAVIAAGSTPTHVRGP